MLADCRILSYLPFYSVTAVQDEISVYLGEKYLLRNRIVLRICRFPVIQRRYRIGIHAFGTLRTEQNLKRRKAEFDIGQEVHAVNIHQVEFQFLVRVGVVLPVNLGVAGKSRLDLEPELEFRHGFVVLFGDLRAFGARADHAHVPFQNVPELGKLVEPTFADPAADRRDPVVVLAGRETRHTVLFGVDAHRAEFENLELPPVLGQADLAVEDGAAVVKFDAERGDKENRAHDDQAARRRNDIENPFREGVFGVDQFPFDAKDGRVERGDMFGAPHDRVADTRQEEADDVRFNAVFQDFVPAFGVDPRHEDGFVTGEPVFDLRERTVELNLVDDAVEAFHRFADDGAEPVPTQRRAVNEDRPLLRVRPEIELVSDVRPDDVHDELDRQKEDEDERIVEPPPCCRDCGVEYRHGEELRGELRKEETPRAAVTEHVGVVGAVEEEEEKGIAADREEVVAESDRLYPRKSPVTEVEPCRGEQEHAQT